MESTLIISLHIYRTQMISHLAIAFLNDNETALLEFRTQGCVSIDNPL